VAGAESTHLSGISICRSLLLQCSANLTASIMENVELSFGSLQLLGRTRHFAERQDS